MGLLAQGGETNDVNICVLYRTCDQGWTTVNKLLTELEYHGSSHLRWIYKDHVQCCIFVHAVHRIKIRIYKI